MYNYGAGDIMSNDPSNTAMPITKEMTMGFWTHYQAYYFHWVLIKNLYYPNIMCYLKVIWTLGNSQFCLFEISFKLHDLTKWFWYCFIVIQSFNYICKNLMKMVINLWVIRLNRGVILHRQSGKSASLHKS